MFKKLLFLGIFSLTFSVSAQISLMKDINTGSDDGNPTNFYVYNDVLYFYAEDETGTNTNGTDFGKELWVTDGTTEGTKYFGIDFRTGTSNGSLGNFLEFNEKLYFTAWDNAVAGSRIFESDGTVAGTLSTNNGFSIFNPKVIGNKVYMSNTTGKTVVDSNNSFYEFDGTDFSAVPDSGNGFPQISGGNFSKLGDNLIILYMRYLVTDGAGGSTDANGSNFEPFVYNITDQTYTLLADIDPGDENSSVSNLTELNNKVYFEAEGELWETDGTTTGTIKVSAAETANISGVSNLYAWNDTLFFEGNDNTSDQLWVFNPALNTVTNISKIDGKDHNPVHFVAHNGYVYYAGENDDSTTDYLYRTNGTTIEQLDNTTIADDLVVYQDAIYFEGESSSDTGRELYKLDPSTLSIQNVAFNSISIYPNPSKNKIYISHNLSDEIAFSISDINGKQLIKGNLIDNTIQHNLNSGMYLLTLITNSASKTQKIIVE
ncbi:T9SS type A sorting domain-containing protein [Polaribacter sp. IC066]|uniref:T9SS type A sorting domain-containing protein n=1 Tax=Polaribacter sp. IC066 TaxID=57032 RepID=UPI0011BFD677|nr:T9SS type A sorting domain-containing protein [Polaribacter sp. IC066]TXD58593.1 T9SS type A sorting domain-containing protein [Polaribacter sp. IC066]